MEHLDATSQRLRCVWTEEGESDHFKGGFMEKKGRDENRTGDGNKE